MVWIAQPSEESSSVAATPPWTDPIGLYIHSAGVNAKITRPSSTSAISKSSSSAIGGGGSSPAAILRIASRPGSEAAAAAVASGSDQVNVRVRCMMQPYSTRVAGRAAPPRSCGVSGSVEREQQAEQRQRGDDPHHGLQPGGVGEHAEDRGRDAADADREPERHARRDPEPARQVLLPHHDRDAERHHGHEADRRPAARRRRARSGASMNASSSGIWATIEPTSTLRRPIRSTSRPPTSVPIAPATSIAASAVLRRRLAGAVLADEPDRRERLQAEVDPRSAPRRPRSASRTRPSRPRERSAARPRAALSAAAAALRALQLAAARSASTIATHRGHDRDDQRPGEAEDQHGGRDQDRAEREADVAADREQAHPGPAARARGVVGVARALRVEGGDAEAADPDGERGEPEARRDAGERRCRAPRARRPTGISQESDSRSETAPNAGWMIEEPTVTHSSRAPTAL